MTTPPLLTFGEYISFLESLPLHPSYLYLASKEGRLEEVKEILRKNPHLDVNWRDFHRPIHAALHQACRNGANFIVASLLTHPDIDVNQPGEVGFTPFMMSCFDGFIPCVRLLLKDSRVKVNEPDKYGYTPLFWAARDGHVDIIKWWIASGREMDLGKPGDIGDTDAMRVAENRGETEVVTLLERFKSDPSQTRHAMRAESGWYDEAAAEMFSLVVFVSDG